MKNFIKYLIFTLFFPISLIGIINSIIDQRAYINKNLIKSFEKSLREQGSQSAYFNLPERKLFRIRINYFNEYSSSNNVIIGGSKVLLVGTNTNYKIFNTGLSNFTFNDLKIVSKEFIDLKIKIDTLYINIDAVFFNKKTNLDQWKNFSDSVRPSYIRRLFSIEYLIENLTFPKFRKWDGNDTDYVKFRDGSIRYHKRDRNITHSDIILDQMKNNLTEISLDKKLINDIKKILFDLNANHSILVLSPYNPLIYSKLISEYPIINLLENEINLLENEKIGIIGSYNPNKYNFSKEYFYDQVHLNEKGIKILYEKK